jgi:hypothetical protein
LQEGASSDDDVVVVSNWIATVKAYRASVGKSKAEECLHCRGFTGSVGSQKNDNLTVVDVKRYVVHGP